MLNTHARPAHARLIGAALLIASSLSFAQPVPDAAPEPSPETGEASGALPAEPAASSERGDAEQRMGWRTVEYRGEPLQITLKTGKESFLRFPWETRLAASGDMLDMVRAEQEDGWVYFTPRATFESERFWFVSKTDGSRITVDITSSTDAMPERLSFVISSDVSNQTTAAAPAAPRAQELPDNSQDENSYAAPGPGIVSLARLAFQRVYSPPRVVRPPLGIGEVTREGTPSIDTLVYGESVRATVLHEWSTDDALYVTALELRNVAERTVHLSEDSLRAGPTWVASAFWDTWLDRAGTPASITTLVVITERPWAETIEPSIALGGY